MVCVGKLCTFAFVVVVALGFALAGRPNGLDNAADKGVIGLAAKPRHSVGSTLAEVDGTHPDQFREMLAQDPRNKAVFPVQQTGLNNPAYQQNGGDQFRGVQAQGPRDEAEALVHQIVPNNRAYQQNGGDQSRDMLAQGPRDKAEVPVQIVLNNRAYQQNGEDQSRDMLAQGPRDEAEVPVHQIVPHNRAYQQNGGDQSRDMLAQGPRDEAEVPIHQIALNNPAYQQNGGDRFRDMLAQGPQSVSVGTSLGEEHGDPEEDDDDDDEEDDSDAAAAADAAGPVYVHTTRPPAQGDLDEAYISHGSDHGFGVQAGGKGMSAKDMKAFKKRGLTGEETAGDLQDACEETGKKMTGHETVKRLRKCTELLEAFSFAAKQGHEHSKEANVIYVDQFQKVLGILKTMGGEDQTTKMNEAFTKDQMIALKYLKDVVGDIGKKLNGLKRRS